MPGDHTRSIAQRIADELGVPEVLDALGDEASGTELTSLLLEVFARRTARVGPAELVRRRNEDRFVRPSAIDLRALRWAETIMLDVLPEAFDQVMLAPLVPLGTHRALGKVAQHNVVSTIRRTEVAADPTAGLALEAAVRRAGLLAGNARSAEMVRLATVQRVTRAQQFEGPRSFAHFSLLGLVTAGRDTGNLEFEKQAVLEHAEATAAGCLAAGADGVAVALTDFSGAMGDVVEHVVSGLGGRDGIAPSIDPDRTHARGYYPSVCLKVEAIVGDQRHEYGDGGLVDWGTRLVGSAKERMMISGMSIDRIAIDFMPG